MLGLRGITLAAVAATLAAGCNVVHETAPSPAGEGSEPSTQAGPVFTVGEALAELPASVATPGEAFTLLVGDLAKATDLGGLTRPEDAADAGTWVSQLEGGLVEGEPSPAYVPLPAPLGLSTPAALVEEDLGWSVVDVDHFVSWTSRRLTTTVVAGDFDDQTLAGLPGTNGISSAGTGPDLVGDLETASPARPQGNPLRMTVEGESLIASPLTPVVEEWRDDRQRTLADYPVLSDLAAVLDEAGAVSAKISTGQALDVLPPPRAILDLVREQSGGDPFPDFDAYAIGWTAENGQPGFVVAYHTRVDIDRTEDQITQRWEGINYRGQDMSAYVEITDVEAAGDIVVVSGSPAPDNGGEVVMNMSEAGDLPFISDSGLDPSYVP